MDDYEPIELRLSRDPYTKKISVECGEMQCVEAEMAYRLIERWGLVAGELDGEDSAGRAQYRLLAPADVVARAVTMTELFYREIRARGWTVQVAPVLAEAGEKTG